MGVGVVIYVAGCYSMTCASLGSRSLFFANSIPSPVSRFSGTGAGGYREHDVLVVGEGRAENSTKFPFRPEHLITTNTETRWLASEYTQGDGAALNHAKLREMQRFVEESDELMLKPRTLKAVEAARIFAGQEGRNTPAAIVLTEHGKRHQVPLGLCSQINVAQRLRALGV